MRYLKKHVVLAVLIAMLVQASACGTLLYPERRGQTHGQIDTAVALMDGIGILFFVIPGLVAFIIDFNTGAIYLPSRRRFSNNSEFLSLEQNDMTIIKPKHMDKTEIENIVSNYTGRDIDLDNERLRVYRYKNTEELSKVLLQLQASRLAQSPAIE